MKTNEIIKIAFDARYYINSRLKSYKNDGEFHCIYDDDYIEILYDFYIELLELIPHDTFIFDELNETVKINKNHQIEINIGAFYNILNNILAIG